MHVRTIEHAVSEQNGLEQMMLPILEGRLRLTVLSSKKYTESNLDWLHDV